MRQLDLVEVDATGLACPMPLLKAKRALNAMQVGQCLRVLAEQGIECSMSGAGNCYDNAVVESWFGLLKRGRVHRRHYRTRDEARLDVFDYIERFYNRRRPHGSAGRMSPLQYEESTLNQPVH
jgi:transposase InsO family protein